MATPDKPPIYHGAPALTLNQLRALAIRMEPLQNYEIGLSTALRRSGEIWEARVEAVQNADDAARATATLTCWDGISSNELGKFTFPFAEPADVQVHFVRPMPRATDPIAEAAARATGGKLTKGFDLFDPATYSVKFSLTYKIENNLTIVDEAQRDLIVGNLRRDMAEQIGTSPILDLFDPSLDTDDRQKRLALNLYNAWMVACCANSNWRTAEGIQMADLLFAQLAQYKVIHQMSAAKEVARKKAVAKFWKLVGKPTGFRGLLSQIIPESMTPGNQE